MEDDQNAFAGLVNGEDEDGRTGAVDPGYADEQEAQAVQEEKAPQEEGYTESVRKRIHAQAKKHQREMRELQEQMMHMQHQLSGDSANPQDSYNSNPYPSPGQPNPPSMSEDERIQHAVRYALGAKEHEERKAQEAQKMAQVQKHYRRLSDEFDKASEKYEDFDDVVRGDDVPFTKDIRDLLLFTQNPADVAYKLGKNRNDLERISKLHPIDMAHEINKLSFSLMGGNDGKSSNTHKSTPMGTIRNNPAHSSSAVTDKTPPSAIRARMKAGTWK